MIKNLFTKATLVRTLSGIVLILFAVIALLYGNIILFSILAAVSIIGMMELYRIVNIHKNLLGLIGYGAAIIYYIILFNKWEQYNQLLFICLLMAIMIVFVFTFPKYQTEQVLMAYFGFFYVAVMMSYIYQIRNMEQGIFLVWMVFISAWVCDTCAYLTGVMWGKHKLAPKLSPKKSIEGSLGGIIGSVLIGALYGYFLKETNITWINPIVGCSFICGIASVISQIGDLAASAIKRKHNVKDYGHLIPGHGGILDRFDSVIFVAPAIYFLCSLLYF